MRNLNFGGAIRAPLTATTLAVVISNLPAPARCETLADAVAAAYETNPTLQAQRAALRALDESYVQARAGWQPTLSAQANRSVQGIRSPVRDLNAFALHSGTIENGWNEAGQITFDQPLWTGGRTAAAVTAARAAVLQGREQLRSFEIQLMQQVITAYADTLRDQQSVDVQQQYLDIVRKQLEEDRADFDVGVNTRTDVATSQSRLSGARMQLRSAEGQLRADEAAYAALVGHNSRDLAPLPSLDYLMPASADDAFSVAEQNNPALRAQEFAEAASRAQIAEARAARMPTVALQSGVAYNRVHTFPYISHGYEAVETATINITVPLVSAGVTSSKIRQTIEQNNSDRITIEAQRLTVLQTVTETWSLLSAARDNLAEADEQVRAATVAYDGMHVEEEAGLRSNLDVLTVAQDFASAKLGQATTEHDAYVLSANLLASMGRLEVRNLVPSQPSYDPQANMRNLRLTWGWVPWVEPIGAVDSMVVAPSLPRVRELPREPAISPGLQPAPSDPHPPLR